MCTKVDIVDIAGAEATADPPGAGLESAGLG